MNQLIHKQINDKLNFLSLFTWH